jgi:hypothetical protein
MEMEMENADKIDNEVTELIRRKIAAEDADSGWVVAWTAMRMLPVLKEIAAGLDAINRAIAPDNAGSPTVTQELRRISSLLEDR